MEVEIDHYRVLGLPSGDDGAKLSEKDILTAYKRKALELHPDKRPLDDSNVAHAEFLNLKSSFDVLNDDKQRKQFDTHLLLLKTQQQKQQKQQQQKQQKQQQQQQQQQQPNSEQQQQKQQKQQQQKQQKQQQERQRVAAIKRRGKERAAVIERREREGEERRAAKMLEKERRTARKLQETEIARMKINATRSNQRRGLQL